MHTPHSIREAFYIDKKHSEETLQIIIGSTAEDSISTAYKGIATTMLAEFALMPMAKLAHFHSGKNLIETAIAQHPNNSEIRHIRLLVQLNAPSLVGYNENIQEDFDYFFSHLQEEAIDTNWKIRFIETLSKTKKITPEQVEKLTAILPQ